MRTQRVSLAVFALAAVTVAGCGNGSAGTGSTTASQSSNRAKAVKFVECMRNHGVSQFPDPDASGNITIDEVANGSSVNTNDAAFKQAFAACKELEPPGFTGTPRSPEQQSAALKFAQCVRNNGVKDFPDPVKGEPLIDTNLIPSANRPGGMSILNAATHKCSSYAAAALAKSGR